MFDKILIANRGEIACRIIRTTKRLGIKTVAVYSEADQYALHVQMADEALLIGPAPSQESYLNIKAILHAAIASGAQAIHPGYGFLSENTEFAQACHDANIIFIGPSPAAILAMGEKDQAKDIMANAGVPVISGYYGDQRDAATLQTHADKIGYPILIKAVAGGGGKGMRVVHKSEDFNAALISAQREAKSSFGDDAVMLEQYLTPVRHVEVQIFADNHGNAVHLFERDCSMQRRHQKIIEEAPAPGINEKLRQRIGQAAVTAARTINYCGAGTVEFLLTNNQQFYFLEMNTRLQVEHPVTEMITGLDLVEWQLRIAAGERLPLTQQQITYQGHAFEARICAEDPQREFLPSIGRINYYRTPLENKHMRVDSGIQANASVTIYYDPLLAKLIVWGKDRITALEALKQALTQCQIIGVVTNIPLLYAIANHPAFTACELSTSFITQYLHELVTQPIITDQIIIIAALALLLEQQLITQQWQYASADNTSPWFVPDGWRLNLAAEQTLTLWHVQQMYTIKLHKRNSHHIFNINNKSYQVTGELTLDGQLHASINDEAIKATAIKVQNSLHLFIIAEHYYFALNNSYQSAAREHEGATHMTSPMPGTIISINIQSGQKVNKGDSLVVIEAMKMEHTLYAPNNGIVKEVFFDVGDLINEGVELLALETAT